MSGKTITSREQRLTKQSVQYLCLVLFWQQCEYGGSDIVLFSEMWCRLFRSRIKQQCLRIRGFEGSAEKISPSDRICDDLKWKLLFVLVAGVSAWKTETKETDVAMCVIISQYIFHQSIFILEYIICDNTTIVTCTLAYDLTLFLIEDDTLCTISNIFFMHVDLLEMMFKASSFKNVWTSVM